MSQSNKALSPQEGGLPLAADLDRYLRAVRDQQAVLDLSIFPKGELLPLPPLWGVRGVGGKPIPTQNKHIQYNLGVKSPASLGVFMEESL